MIAIEANDELKGPTGDTTLLQPEANSTSQARGVGVAQTFLPAGTRLHEYKIVRVLGHGGFGITYLARDTHLDKPVAIKEYLPAHLAVRSNTHVSVRSANEQKAFEWGRKQFLKEAQTLGRFTHPNVVPVHRFFQANQTAYFVMTYVEGETLAARLKRDPQPSEEALRAVLLPVISGLKAVHRGGCLHRDIKPENILIQPDETPMLIDFGAARVDVESVTRSTICALTAGYAALEQYGSADTQGPWTDVYALGAVAYRAVSGTKPPDAVNRISEDTMLPARVVGEGRYSPAFLEAIDWALSVHPEDRPRNVAELQKALNGTLKRGQKPQPTLQPPAVHMPVPMMMPALKLTALPEREPKERSSFPWATALAPLLALGVVASMVSVGLRQADTPPQAVISSDKSEVPSPVATMAPRPEQAEAAQAKSGQVGPVTKPAAAAVASAAAASAIKAHPAITPLAQLEPLARFNDCAGCPAMTVLAPSSGKHLAVGRYEITSGQYQACAKDGGCRTGFTGAEDSLPATNVDWSDAQSYAAWLSRKTGRRYRLPTEAEWDLAARAGTQGQNFWPATARSCAYANATDGAGCRDGHNGLAPVGSYKANGYAVYDTEGNVWEWTSDCWADKGPAPKAGAACAQRATRGGSWRTPASALRTALRTPVEQAHRSDTLGFRVVAD